MIVPLSKADVGGPHIVFLFGGFMILGLLIVFVLNYALNWFLVRVAVRVASEETRPAPSKKQLLYITAIGFAVDTFAYLAMGDSFSAIEYALFTGAIVLAGVAAASYFIFFKEALKEQKKAELAAVIFGLLSNPVWLLLAFSNSYFAIFENFLQGLPALVEPGFVGLILAPIAITWISLFLILRFLGDNSDAQKLTLVHTFGVLVGNVPALVIAFFAGIAGSIFFGVFTFLAVFALFYTLVIAFASYKLVFEKLLPQRKAIIGAMIFGIIAIASLAGISVSLAGSSVSLDSALRPRTSGVDALSVMQDQLRDIVSKGYGCTRPRTAIIRRGEVISGTQVRGDMVTLQDYDRFTFETDLPQFLLSEGITVGAAKLTEIDQKTSEMQVKLVVCGDTSLQTPSYKICISRNETSPQIASCAP